jgi:hypothetical protein
MMGLPHTVECNPLTQIVEAGAILLCELLSGDTNLLRHAIFR